MDVGLSVIFQNPNNERPDAQVYAEDLALAHFLTYVASRTTRAKLGSMAPIMPHEEANRNMNLFARSVMPELKKPAPSYERLGVPA